MSGRQNQEVDGIRCAIVCTLAVAQVARSTAPELNEGHNGPGHNRSTSPNNDEIADCDA